MSSQSGQVSLEGESGSNDESDPRGSPRPIMSVWRLVPRKDEPLMLSLFTQFSSRPGSAFQDIPVTSHALSNQVGNAAISQTVSDQITANPTETPQTIGSPFRTGAIQSFGTPFEALLNAAIEEHVTPQAANNLLGKSPLPLGQNESLGQNDTGVPSFIAIGVTTASEQPVPQRTGIPIEAWQSLPPATQSLPLQTRPAKTTDVPNEHTTPALANNRYATLPPLVPTPALAPSESTDDISTDAELSKTLPPQQARTNLHHGVPEATPAINVIVALPDSARPVSVGVTPGPVDPDLLPEQSNKKAADIRLPKADPSPVNGLNWVPAADDSSFDKTDANPEDADKPVLEVLPIAGKVPPTINPGPSVAPPAVPRAAELPDDATENRPDPLPGKPVLPAAENVSASYSQNEIRKAATPATMAQNHPPKLGIPDSEIGSGSSKKLAPEIQRNTDPVVDVIQRIDETVPLQSHASEAIAAATPGTQRRESSDDETPEPSNMGQPAEKPAVVPRPDATQPSPRSESRTGQTNEAPVGRPPAARQQQPVQPSVDRQHTPRQDQPISLTAPKIQRERPADDMEQSPTEAAAISPTHNPTGIPASVGVPEHIQGEIQNEVVATTVATSSPQFEAGLTVHVPSQNADAPPPPSSAVTNQVVNAVEKAVETNVSPLRIRLDPPELGNVTVEVRRESGHVEIEIHFESAHALKAAREGAESLRETLTAKGIDIEPDQIRLRLDVSRESRVAEAGASQSEDRGSGRDAQQRDGQQHRQSAEQNANSQRDDRRRDQSGPSPFEREFGYDREPYDPPQPTAPTRRNYVHRTAAGIQSIDIEV